MSNLNIGFAQDLLVCFNQQYSGERKLVYGPMGMGLSFENDDGTYPFYFVPSGRKVMKLSRAMYPMNLYAIEGALKNYYDRDAVFDLSDFGMTMYAPTIKDIVYGWNSGVIKLEFNSDNS